MKSKGILPDTCAWIDYFRNNPSSLARTVEQALSNGEVYVCGTVLYELVQGVRSEKEQTLVLDALRGLTYLEMSEALWIKAGRLAAMLKKQGKTLPFSDIIIATLALEFSLTVLTIDSHFEQIPGVVVLSKN